MQRLSADDRLMLWPDQRWPQENGALAVLDGRVSLAAVRAAVESRLHLVPRLRQVLITPGPGQGGPLWTDAPDFDVHDHVRVRHVPAPGDEAAVLAVVEDLLRQPLDHSRPLWEAWLLSGLPDGREGLFVRLHHAVADGLAGIATIATFLTDGPEPLVGPSPLWTPAPAPKGRELFVDNVRSRLRAVRPLTAVRRLRAAWPALHEIFTREPAPRTSLDRLVGPDRRLALVRADLSDVTDIAHRHHATVNDVLLALLASGLRRLLQHRGEPGVTLPVYVPVSLRRPEERAHARGNQVAQMVVPLPLGTADPMRRLGLIAAETRARKARARPAVGELMRGPISRRVVLMMVARQHVNVTTADLPGPAAPLYLAGARVREVYPVLPLIGTVGLGLAALSYAGRLGITVVADRDAYPDLDVFTAAVRTELRALVLQSTDGALASG